MRSDWICVNRVLYAYNKRNLFSNTEWIRAILISHVFPPYYCSVRIVGVFRQYSLSFTSALVCLSGSPVQQLLQLAAIRGDQFLFQLTALDLHRYVIVVGGDKAAAALEVGDLHDLRF